nr:molecular chaperone HtpG [Deltaproteobacteria bacterium]
MGTTEAHAPEHHSFQAEVSQVLDLVIHSLYSHREVFLRELISNASDAIDKLRFRSVTEAGLMGEEPLRIRLIPDEAAGTLTIDDNGVGMTHDELIEHLGTIASSGSKKFLESLKAKGGKPDLTLIGQFGVGFYASWLVADRVSVVSRAAGSEEAWCWSSNAKDGFDLESATRETRGTSVILHLKEDQKDFLQSWQLRDLVQKYSDFVGHPIEMAAEKEEPKEGEEPKAEEPAFEAINQARALWQRPRSEITDEQYKDFYKHLTNDWEEPLAWAHFKVEGSQEFTGLLYLPRRPPFEMDTPGEGRRGVKLFVKRVFIMDNCDALVPLWLRFVRGLIDSDDLPLNVSRETLQDSAVVRAIKKQVARKTLDRLDELAKDSPADYATFWAQFGKVVKEGLHLDYEYRERLGSLVRFESSHGDGITSLAEYVGRMKEGQEAIYYSIGETRQAAAKSPHLEALRERGYEVLYLFDPIDTLAADGLKEFQGKKLVNVAMADLKLDASPEAKQSEEAAAGAIKPLIERVKSVLGSRVREVRSSSRLKDSPACLVVPPGAMNPAMERLLRANGREVPPSARVLELNPTHPLMEAIQARAAAGDESLDEWIELLYDQALLTEGSTPDDPHRFAQRMTDLMQRALANKA